MAAVWTDEQHRHRCAVMVSGTDGNETERIEIVEVFLLLIIRSAVARSSSVRGHMVN